MDLVHVAVALVGEAGDGKRDRSPDAGRGGGVGCRDRDAAVRRGPGIEREVEVAEAHALLAAAGGVTEEGLPGARPPDARRNASPVGTNTSRSIA